MMSNEQLIKFALSCATVVVLFGVIVFATSAVPNTSGLAQQNTNSNTNTNQNANQNSNTNTRTANSNNGNASEQAATTGMSSQERNFMRDAAMGGLMEVELGRMATEKGASDAVKQFGQKMVDDHTRVNAELTQLAASKGMSVPTELGAKHRADVTSLSNLSGAEFDKAYAKLMVSSHKKKVSAFEKQSKGGADAELKAFAAKTLPGVQEHLQMARALTGTGGSGGSNTNANSNSNSNKP
jgi:putative membrane protein